jgi:hypothetical protein
MPTYVLLIYTSEGEEAPISAAENARVLAEHRELQKETSARSELHAVARLDEPAAAKTVRIGADGHEVMDGPYVETKEWLVGFYLLDCRDEAAAIEHAKRICPVGAHAIEVRPTTWRWRS